MATAYPPALPPTRWPIVLRFAVLVGLWVGGLGLLFYALGWVPNRVYAPVAQAALQLFGGGALLFLAARALRRLDGMRLTMGRIFYQILLISALGGLLAGGLTLVVYKIDPELNVKTIDRRIAYLQEEAVKIRPNDPVTADSVERGMIPALRKDRAQVAANPTSEWQVMQGTLLMALMVGGIYGLLLGVIFRAPAYLAAGAQETQRRQALRAEATEPPPHPPA